MAIKIAGKSASTSSTPTTAANKGKATGGGETVTREKLSEAKRPKSRLSQELGKVSMGFQKLPRLALGAFILKILGTERAKESAAIVVTFEYAAVGDEENDTHLIGKKCSKVYSFGGDVKNGQRDLRTQDWTRFVVATAGFETLEAFNEAGHDVDDILDGCELTEGEGSQPLTGALVQVENVDSGKVTNPSANGKYKGGEPIHNQRWTPYEEEAEAAAE